MKGAKAKELTIHPQPTTQEICDKLAERAIRGKKIDAKKLLACVYLQNRENSFALTQEDSN